jgi:2-keto-4-pentenoate hydratase/2-oxohepta-3-ene-1,7-dioic acid hydratase in catechol pathway
VHIAQVDTADGPRLTAVRNGEHHPIGTPGSGDLRAVLAEGVNLRDLAVRAEPVAGVTLRAPLTPRKIVAIGLNYRDHVRETGMELPTAPLVFTKFTTSVIGPGQPIVFDRTLTERVDWEVELGVVIGRSARRVSEADAHSYVFGYVVANDVSARDLQFADAQWVRGKSLDTFCPLGPAVVTADEVPEPERLRLTTRVNGDRVQDSNTAEMVFGVAELISYCSRSFTLEPGDLLLTGTPWGCGEFMNPPRHLHDGDVVECEVEGLGVATNPVRERSLEA